MHDGYAVHPSAMLKDGWFAYNGTLYADAIAAKRPRVTPVTVLKLADGRPKEYGRVTTGSLTLTLPGGGTISGNGRAAQRINQDGLVRFAPNGGFLVSVDRVPRQAGGRAQYTLRRVSPDGHVERERTFYAPAVKISDSHMRDFVNSYTDAMRKGPRRRYFPSAGSARDYLLTNLPLPTAYPLVSGLLVGTDSSVWLRGIDEGRSQVSWTVLSDRFEPEFTVLLPADYSPKAATRNEIWGTTVDNDDVPLLVRYARTARRE